MHLDDPADAEAGAWCNLNQLDFDARIMYLPDVTAMNMLCTLLKQLCKSRMDKSCRDGCDDCPITAVLATAKLAAEQARRVRTRRRGFRRAGPEILAGRRAQERDT